MSLLFFMFHLTKSKIRFTYVIFKQFCYVCNEEQEFDIVFEMSLNGSIYDKIQVVILTCTAIFDVFLPQYCSHT